MAWETDDTYSVSVEEEEETFSVEVTVLDAQTGDPIPDALVYLNRKSGYTDSEGKLTYTDVHAGEYTVVAYPSGYHSSEVERITVPPSASVTLHCEPS